MGAALTLLENRKETLPLIPNANYGYLSLGDASGEAFKKQLQRYAQITTIEGRNFQQIQSKTTELEGLIVGFHRSDKTPWKSERFSKDEIKLLSKLQQLKIPVIVTVFVKPYAVAQLNKTNAFDGLLLRFCAFRTPAKEMTTNDEAYRFRATLSTSSQ